MVATNIGLPWFISPQYVGTYYFDPNLTVAPAIGFFGLVIDDEKSSGVASLVRGRILDSVGIAEFEGIWSYAGMEITKKYLRTSPDHNLSQLHKVHYEGSQIEEGLFIGHWNFIGVDKPAKPFIMSSRANYRFERFKQIYDSLNLRDI